MSNRGKRRKRNPGRPGGTNWVPILLVGVVGLLMLSRPQGPFFASVGIPARTPPTPGEQVLMAGAGAAGTVITAIGNRIADFFRTYESPEPVIYYE